MIWAILLLLAACDSVQTARTAAPPSLPPDPIAIPSVESPVPTPIPTETFSAVIVPVLPAAPIPSPTPACDDAPDTRLIVRELGQVSDDDDRPLNVRSGPGTEYRILGRLEVLDIFLVLEGPRCGGNYVWYRVRRGELEGWIAEGDFGVYYVRPYFPG